MDYSTKLSENFGFITAEELVLLKSTINLCEQSPMVLDIGTGAGTSLLAVLETRPMSYIISLDIIPSAVAERVKSAGFSTDRISLIVQDSLKYAEDYEGRFDVIILDADHRPEQVDKELRAWMPHLVVGGYLIVHDYGEEIPMWKKKKDVVDKYARYNSFNLLEQAGSLAVFEKQSNKRKRSK